MGESVTEKEKEEEDHHQQQQQQQHQQHQQQQQGTTTMTLDVGIVDYPEEWGAAAVIVQTAWRGLAARNRYDAERANRQWAAVKVQAFFRARKARKVFAKHMRCALRVCFRSEFIFVVSSGGLCGFGVLCSSVFGVVVALCLLPCCVCFFCVFVCLIFSCFGGWYLVALLASSLKAHRPKGRCWLFLSL